MSSDSSINLPNVNIFNGDDNSKEVAATTPSKNLNQKAEVEEEKKVVAETEEKKVVAEIEEKKTEMEEEEKTVEITRLEVINHADNDKPIGRILTLHKELGDFNSIELSYQDDGRTLKVFIKPLNKQD